MKKNKQAWVAGLGAFMIAAMLLSFTSNDGKKKRYHVISQKDGKVMEFDTIIPMSSTYSVEDFLADKGIESEHVEIIKMPSMKGQDMFIHEGDETIFIEEIGADIDPNINHKTIKIIAELDDNGQMITKKFVNGEEVEMTEEELEEIEHMQQNHEQFNEDQIKFEHRKMDDGEAIEHDVQIRVMIDDDGKETITKIENGEEVTLTQEELEQLHAEHEHDGAHKIIRMKIDEGDMEELMRELEIEMEELNIQMDSLQKEIRIEMHHNFKELDKMEEMEWIDDNAVHMVMRGGDEDFTIVMVTENIDNEAPIQRRKGEIKQQRIAVYPNPNEGVFTLKLDQTEKLKTSINITDASGKVVFKENLGKFEGTYEKEIDLKKYGAGTYILNVERGDQSTSEKLIVK